MPRRAGYRRLRPSDGRVMQALWEALRAEPGLSTADLAERAGTTRNTAKSVLARFEREGLVGRDEVENPPPLNATALWRLERDIGPVAPILHGVRDRDSGFTDPNI